MEAEKIQNNETEELSQGVPSFEEIKQKVIRLNNEVYKEKTYTVGVTLFASGTVPNIGVKTEKRNLQGDKIKKDSDNVKLPFSRSLAEYGYTKMGRKEKERFESDTQEMSQVILDLCTLYGLDLSDKENLYVTEDSGNLVITCYDSMEDTADDSKGNGDANILKESKPNVQIICDGEKAIFQRDGKVEGAFKKKTLKEMKVCKDFNDIYDGLCYEEIGYDKGNGDYVAIIVGNTMDGGKAITIVEGVSEYSLIMTNNGNFKSESIKGDTHEKDVIDQLSPEDVAKSLQNIQEKINEGKMINAQKTTEEFDEIQANEGSLAEQELDKALENI